MELVVFSHQIVNDYTKKLFSISNKNTFRRSIMGHLSFNKNSLMNEIRCDEPSYLIWKWHPAGSQQGNTLSAGDHL